MDNEELDRLGEALGRGMPDMPQGTGCIGPEDMAALMEGAVPDDERGRMLGHIASCADCREVYMLMLAAGDVPAEAEPSYAAPRPPMRNRMLRYALAACLALVAVSGYVYYSGLGPQEADIGLVAKMGTKEYAPPQSGPDTRGLAQDKSAGEPDTEQSRSGGTYADQPSLGLARENSVLEKPAPEPQDSAVREYRYSDDMQDAAPPPVPAPQRKAVRAPDEEMRSTEEEKAEVPGASEMFMPAGSGSAAGKAMVCVPGSECGVVHAPDSGPAPASAAEEEPSVADRDVMPVETGISTARKKEVEGELKSIDLKTGEAVIRPTGASEDMKITAADPSDLRNFKPGDMVRVYYEERDVNLASRIKKLRTVVIPVGC